VVHGRPSSWRRPTHTHHGHVFNPNAAAQQHFRDIAATQLPGDFERFTGPIRVEFEFVFEPSALGMFGAPGGRADLDNLIKFALDAGNGFLYTDDMQVCEIHAKKRFVRYGEEAKTIMKIEEI
jgi:Holliday junction resolvase RusA-like endonuclease